MSSQSDEFQVLQPSNVKGNPRNKPSLYETELAKPLDLPGEWDVALINISYPHNWTNLDKFYQYFLLRFNTGDSDSEFVPENEKEETDLYNLIQTQAQFRGWLVDRAPQIPRGNYDISKILELIETQFNLVFSNKTINLKIDPYQNRVEINPTEQFAVACYAERSILHIGGFGLQSIVQKTPGKRTFEFLIFDPNKYIQAKLPPSIKRISNMYVYSDIVELSRVGKSQVPIMGFLPIKSNFQENGHWVFNPPLYVRVREKNIRTITIKISTETGEEFPILDDVVTCRLNFRRRPYLI